MLPESLQRALVAAPADLVVPQDFAAQVDDGRFVRRQFGQGFALADGVHHARRHAGLPRRGGVGVPDVLAVHLPRRHQHRQLRRLVGQAGLVAQVLVEGGSVAAGLGDMGQHRPRPIGRHIRPVLRNLVKSGLLAGRGSGAGRQG